LTGAAADEQDPERDQAGADSAQAPTLIERNLSGRLGVLAQFVLSEDAEPVLAFPNLQKACAEVAVAVESGSSPPSSSFSIRARSC
jgi:hypothetical protein